MSTAKSHTKVSRQTDTAPIYVTVAHQQADFAQYACRKGLKGSRTRELQCVAVSKDRMPSHDVEPGRERNKHPAPVLELG